MSDTRVEKAIVTVLGRDKGGIIAAISTLLWQRGINILDLSQTILDGYFTMVMLVDIAGATGSFLQIQDELAGTGEALGLEARIQRSEIFDAMHRV